MRERDRAPSLHRLKKVPVKPSSPGLRDSWRSSWIMTSVANMDMRRPGRMFSSSASLNKHGGGMGVITNSYVTQLLCNYHFSWMIFSLGCKAFPSEEKGCNFSSSYIDGGVLGYSTDCHGFCVVHHLRVRVLRSTVTHCEGFLGHRHCDDNFLYIGNATDLVCVWNRLFCPGSVHLFGSRDACPLRCGDV